MVKILSISIVILLSIGSIARSIHCADAEYECVFKDEKGHIHRDNGSGLDKYKFKAKCKRVKLSCHQKDSDTDLFKANCINVILDTNSFGYIYANTVRPKGYGCWKF